jgi:ABC-2 type transport system ATP-binding protein
MRHLLRQLAADGRTVFVSSHVLSEVQQLVDQVVIINRGRLVRQGALTDLTALAEHQVVSVRTPTPDDLVSALTSAATSALAGAYAGADDPARPTVRVSSTGPDTLDVTGLSAAQIGDLAFGAGVRLHELAARRGDLEDVFFALTTDGQPQLSPAQTSHVDGPEDDRRTLI